MTSSHFNYDTEALNAQSGAACLAVSIGNHTIALGVNAMSLCARDQSIYRPTNIRPSTAPAFLQSKSFWEIRDLSDSFSSHVALSFQWVPGYAGLSENKLADSLAKTGATLPFTHVPWPRPLLRLSTRYSFWRRILTTPSPARFLLFPRSNWFFPVSSAVNCPDFIFYSFAV